MEIHKIINRNQIVASGDEKDCMTFLKKEAERLNKPLKKLYINNQMTYWDIGGNWYVHQVEEEADRDILSNKMFDTAWSMFLAVVLIPFVAPAVYIGEMIVDENGDNYYDKNGIAKKDALSIVVPALKATANIVDVIEENKDNFIKLFKSNLELLYSVNNLKVDWTRFKCDVPNATFDEFMNEYYSKVIVVIARGQKEKNE